MLPIHRLVAASLLLVVSSASADLRDLVPEETLKQIAEEVSGEAAKRNLDTITLQHRMRSGAQFDVKATGHQAVSNSIAIDAGYLVADPALRSRWRVRCTARRSRTSSFGTAAQRRLWELKYLAIASLAGVRDAW